MYALLLSYPLHYRSQNKNNEILAIGRVSRRKCTMYIHSGADFLKNHIDEPIWINSCPTKYQSRISFLGFINSMARIWETESSKKCCITGCVCILSCSLDYYQRDIKRLNFFMCTNLMCTHSHTHTHDILDIWSFLLAHHLIRSQLRN